MPWGSGLRIAAGAIAAHFLARQFGFGRVAQLAAGATKLFQSQISEAKGSVPTLAKAGGPKEGGCA